MTDTEMRNLINEIRESVAQSEQDRIAAADREANGFPRPASRWGDDPSIGWN